MTGGGDSPVVRRNYGPLPEIVRARLINTISFYFTNIHDDTKRGDLWKAFGSCGIVKDVFIPAKRNKQGRRFGFVRFAKGGIGEDLLLKLDQVNVLSTKIKVNVSRFERDLVAATPLESSEQLKVQSNAEVSPGLKVGNGASYAAAVVTSPGVSVGSYSSMAEVVCESPPGRSEELSESVVGLLLPKVGVQRIREQLIIAGMPNIKVVSLGGNQVLISSPIQGFLRESLLERSDWWLSWFVGFSKWSVDLPQPGRCVWLRVIGTPAHLWCDKVLHSVGACFGEVLDVDCCNTNYEFGRVLVLVPTVFPVAAPVTLVEGGRSLVVYVREEFMTEGYLGQNFPVTGASAVAGVPSAREEGWSEDEGWAEDVGRSSFSSAASDRGFGEDAACVRKEVSGGDIPIENSLLLDVPSLQENVSGDEVDSERRRKVSLEHVSSGPTCNSKEYEIQTPIASAFDVLFEEEVEHLAHVGAMHICPVMRSSSDAVGPIWNDDSSFSTKTCACHFNKEEVGLSTSVGDTLPGPSDLTTADVCWTPSVGLGCVRPLNLLGGALSAGVGPRLSPKLTPCGTHVPSSLPTSNFVLGSQNDMMALGNLLYNNQENMNHVGTQQIAITPITSDANVLVTNVIHGKPETAEEPLGMQDVKAEQVMVPVQPTISDACMRPHISSSSPSDSGKTTQPMFFSRDAKEKRKPGRPKKIPRGRPKGKENLSLVDASDVTRELFRKAEQRDSLRKYPDNVDRPFIFQNPEGSQVEVTALVDR